MTKSEDTREAWLAAIEAAKARSGEVGVVTVETLRAMSGLDFLRGIAEGSLPRPPINDVLNFFLTEVGKGHAAFMGVPKHDFYNPIGSVHGGWASTLLDSCMGCACQTTLSPGQGYTTVELKVNLVRPLSSGTGPVRAEGKVVSAGRTIITAEGRLAGPDGKLYAHATTTCIVLGI